MRHARSAVQSVVFCQQLILALGRPRDDAIGGANLLSAEVFPVLLLSVLLPGVIVGYSHTIAEKPKTTDTTPPKPTPAFREHWWQFFRPRPAVTATTNNPQAARQTGLESTEGMEAAVDITRSEVEAPISKPPAQPGKPTKAAKRPANPNRERALQLASEGFNTSEIVRMTGEKQSTVASWLYRGAQKNGVAK